MEKIRREVERLLTVEPETRADDMVLYYHYMSENYKDIFDSNSVLLIFANPRFRAENGLPSFASVSRMRRKLQEERADLRPDAQQQRIKKEYERMYREFYKNPLCVSCE